MSFVMEWAQRLTVLFSLAFLIACSETEDNQGNTGQFIFGPTENLQYVTKSGNTSNDSSTEGSDTTSSEISSFNTTNVTGEFSYQSGDIVEFFIGKVYLGSTLGRTKVSPRHLVLDAHHQHRLSNLARFIVTLDEDQDPRNGITLPEPDSFFSNIDYINFSQHAYWFERDPNVLSFVSAAVNRAQLVNTDTALATYTLSEDLHGLDQDSDEDGVPDAYDRFPDDPNESMDTDLDGVGNNTDVDDDGDGLEDVQDPYPLGRLGLTPDLDSDGDGTLDDVDQDVDGDGIINNVDNCVYTSNPMQGDLDGDGWGDFCDVDIDSDFLLNDDDNCPTASNTDQGDVDLDGLGNVCDSDADNDGFVNVIDNCPLVSNIDQADSDRDNIGDLCDPDLDGDGLSNSADNCPAAFNPSQANLDGDTFGDLCDLDVDNDGVNNSEDNCPTIVNTDQSDIDSDNTGDLCDSDIDNDTVLNTDDNCPLVANTDQANTGTIDDNVGDVCDTDDDNDGFEDSVDVFPADPFEWIDTDNDGFGDNFDRDRDGDGVENPTGFPAPGVALGDTAYDNFPLDPTEWFDTDKDGIGDNSDDDIDNDGFLNDDDAFPTDNKEWLDTDGDKIGNNQDNDDDGDERPDDEDVFPLNGDEWEDNDGDGYGPNTQDCNDNDATMWSDEIDQDGICDLIDDDLTSPEAENDTYEFEAGSENYTLTILANDDFGLDTSFSESSNVTRAIAIIQDPSLTSHTFIANDDPACVTIEDGGDICIETNDTPENLMDDYLTFSPITGYTGIIHLNYALYDHNGDYDAAGSTCSTAYFSTVTPEPDTYALTRKNCSIASFTVAVAPVMEYFTVDYNDKPKYLEFEWSAIGYQTAQSLTVLTRNSEDEDFAAIPGLENITAEMREVINLADDDPRRSSVTGTLYKSEAPLPLHLTDWENSEFRFDFQGQSGLSDSRDIAITSLVPEASYEHPSIDPIGWFKATNMEAEDGFGASIALSEDGSTIAVAAIGEDSTATGINGDEQDNVAINSGAVYIFTSTDGDWAQQAYLKAQNIGPANDRFGASLSISADGNTLAVGMPGDRNSATGVNSTSFDSTVDSAGAVYIYNRVDDAWQQSAYLKASRTDVFDEFGASVSLSDDGQTLVVGAPGDDLASNTATDAGASYVFTQNNGNWSQQTILQAGNAEAQDQFGQSVAVSGDGNTIVVGATGESSNSDTVNNDQADNAAISSGAAYVFTRSGNTWSQHSYLKADNSDANDLFGSSISISQTGQLIAIGATGERSDATQPEGDSSNNLEPNSGATYIFTLESNIWSQTAYLKANLAYEFLYGTQVSLNEDGDMLAVSSRSEDSSYAGVNGASITNQSISGGAIYIYQFENNSWSLTSYVKPPIPSDNSYCAEAVALSRDGDSLIMGCRGMSDGTAGIRNRSDYTEDTAPNSGSVFLY